MSKKRPYWENEDGSLRDFEDCWWKPSTWNPVARPFAWALIVLVLLLGVALLGGAA